MWSRSFAAVLVVLATGCGGSGFAEQLTASCVKDGGMTEAQCKCLKPGTGPGALEEDDDGRCSEGWSLHDDGSAAVHHGGSQLVRRPTRAWLVVSLAWVVPSLFAALQAFAQHRLNNWGGELWKNVLFDFIDWLLYGAITPIVFYFARRVPLVRAHLVRRILLHLGAALLTCALWAAGGTLLRALLYPDDNLLTSVSFVGWFFTSLPFGVAAYFAVLGIEHGIFYFLESREREAQAARLSGQLAEARLGALRMQMRPHFLLNSLNAILVLVRDRDHATATRVLEELGEVLRYVLRSERPQKVALADEIDFLRRYLAIEQVRFSDRLRTQFRLDPDVMAALVPDLILQPVVENALRHGIANRVEAGAITIAARHDGEQLVLAVSDEGVWDGDEGQAGAGIGLRNTRERLQVLYGGAASLEIGSSGTETVVTISIPYETR
jgi:two-component system, LytTR family, sensor kinase